MLCGSAESDVALLPSNSGHRKTCHKKQLNRFSLVQIDMVEGVHSLVLIMISDPPAPESRRTRPQAFNFKPPRNSVTYVDARGRDLGPLLLAATRSRVKFDAAGALLASFVNVS